MTRLQPHPGEILEQHYLVPRGMSARKLAAAIDVAPNQITAIINGDRAVTADTAIRLGRFFQTTSEFWLKLQMAHDLARAERTSVPTDTRVTDPTKAGSLVARSVAFSQELRARSRAEQGKPADKAFIDSLYEKA